MTLIKVISHHMMSQRRRRFYEFIRVSNMELNVTGRYAEAKRIKYIKWFEKVSRCLGDIIYQVFKNHTENQIIVFSDKISPQKI